jgi:hypothetical protein
LEKVCTEAIERMLEDANRAVIDAAGQGAHGLRDYKLVVRPLRRAEFEDAFAKIRPKTGAEALRRYRQWAGQAENDEQGPYIEMEYVEGWTLRQEVSRSPGGLPPKRACELGRLMCDALSAAHALGVIHRDVKPGNILMTLQGTPKLGDFGLAAVHFEGQNDQQDITASSAMLGTLYYASPEQLSDAREVDARSDVYSLGATLYFMLTGDDPRALRFDLLPPAIRPVLEKAMERDPAARFQDMKAFDAALRKAQEAPDDETSEPACPQCRGENPIRRATASIAGQAWPSCSSLARNAGWKIASIKNSARVAAPTCRRSPKSLACASTFWKPKKLMSTKRCVGWPSAAWPSSPPKGFSKRSCKKRLRPCMKSRIWSVSWRGSLSKTPTVASSCSASCWHGGQARKSITSRWTKPRMKRLARKKNVNAFNACAPSRSFTRSWDKRRPTDCRSGSRCWNGCWN